MTNPALAGRQSGLAPRQVRRDSLLARRWRWHTASGLADRTAPHTRGLRLEILLEQLSAANVSSADGGIYPSALLGRAIPRRSERRTGLGAIPRALVARLSPECGADHVKLQFLSLVRMASTPENSATRSQASGFFPPNGIGGGNRSQPSIAKSLSDYESAP